MQIMSPRSTSNKLLDSLPRKEQEIVFQQCKKIKLEFGDILCERDSIYQYVYFPTTCFISIVAILNNKHPLELGLIGNEGMLGSTLTLGVKTAPSRAIVQGAGEALRMSAASLVVLIKEINPLQEVLKKYLYVLMIQLTQNAACAHFHEIEPRLARWLLMTQDRAQSDQFHLTHEFLSDMLGVRRSGVTIAAGALQFKNLIHYSRGDITILNRAGLEAAACNCYSVLVKDHAKLFPSCAPLILPVQ